MRTAAAYARYSTDKQTENSILYQLSEIQKYAAGHDLLIVQTYTDEGKSGTNAEREGFQRLQKAARAHEFEAVIVYDVSRGSRDVGDWFAFRKAMMLCGVEVVSATGQKLGSMMNSQEFLMELLTVGMGQAEVLNTRQKSIDGVAVRAREGVFLGGVPPLGYDVDNGRYIINEAEAAVVRCIFQMYADGKSYEKILTAVKGTAGKRGRPIGKNSLHSILTNERYIGIYTWNKRRVKTMGKWAGGEENPDCVRIEDAVPTIIDPATWAAVQQRLKDRKRNARNGAKRDYLLTGMLTCSCCGAAYIGHTSRNKKGFETSSYICGNKYRTRTCTAKNVSAAALEEFVVQQVRGFLTKQDFHRMAEELAQIINAAGADATAKKKELAQIEKKISNGVAAILAGADVPELLAQIQQLKEKKNALTDEIQTIAQNYKPVNVDSLADMLKKDACAAAETLDADGLKRLIRLYVTGIHVQENGDCIVEVGISADRAVSSGGDGVVHKTTSAPPQPIVCTTIIFRRPCRR